MLLSVVHWALAETGQAESAAVSMTSMPPMAPSLSDPDDGIYLSSSNVEQMTWLAVSHASSYRIQCSRTDLFTSLFLDENGLTDLTYECSFPNAREKYYWRVCAINAAGEGDFSDIWSVISYGPPAAPVLSFPEDGFTLLSRQAVMTWESLDYSTSYKLQVSTSQTFSPLETNESGLTETSYSALLSATGTTYYWRVCGNNVTGDGAYSTVGRT